MRIFSLLLTALVLLAAACSDDDTASGPQPSTGSSEWLVMVYIAADNSLSFDALDDLNEMKASSLSGDRIRAVVLVDRAGADNSHVYEIKNGQAIQLAVPELGLPASGAGEVDTGSPAVLSNFIRFAKSNYHATNYALILWNHGGGWKSPAFRKTSSGIVIKPARLTKDICWDDYSDSYLGNNDVQQVVKGSGIRLLAMDACLMGMVETAYEMRKSVTGIDYLVFSQETEPSGGYQYTALFNAFNSATDTSASNFARIIAAEYLNHYGASSDLTQSAVDLSRIDSVVSALNSFVTYLETRSSNELDNARANCTTFAYPTHVDLWSFADNFADPSATALKTAIEQAVIANAAGSGIPGARGLSILFTTVNHEPGYSDSDNQYSIDFLNGSTWDNFLTSRVFGYTIASGEPYNNSPEAFYADPGVFTNYIIDASDEDFLSLVITATGTLTVGLSNIPATADYDIELQNGSFQTIAGSDSGLYGSPESFSTHITAPGTYHLLIYASDGFSLARPYILTLGGTATY